MMRMRWKTTHLTIGVILLSAVPLGAQVRELKVRSIGDDIFIEGPGIWKRLVLEVEPYKEGVLLSPEGRKIIYHDKFDPYKLPPLPQPVTTFTVIDVDAGKLLYKIPLYWGNGRTGRFLYAVEWLNERFVAVPGEGSLALLDTEEGKQTHNLWGSRFSLAPDRKKIVFVRGTPLIYFQHPEEYQSLLSDYVMLALVEKGRPVTKENTSSNLTAMTVFPEISPFGEMVERSYRDLRERHFMRSGFCWSPDSRKVAFVEGHRGAFWVVVLEIEVKDSEVKVSPRRFELAKELGEVTGVEWTSEDQAIKVVTEKVTYVVDLGTGEVQVQRSQ
jgi:hypothetical protein